MLKEFTFKKFGNTELTADSWVQSFSEVQDQIKILFLPAGAMIKVDFREYTFQTDALLFVNPHVVMQPISGASAAGELIHFNRDFYCIEIHDHEVACDGILYNNVFEIPFIELSESQSAEIQNTLREIKAEMAQQDANTEEMLRILLKLIILKSTRIWKRQHQLAETDQQADVQFLRKFSQLVEKHFKTHHAVSDYADMLFVSAKTLSKKISLVSNDSPNDIIKDRIILESKRLLAHTALTVKEIAHRLNYEDDAYFVRFFTKHTGLSPTSFRKQF
jgi:AraC family transcriptional regulator, transcriptional activator of pobA